MTGFKVVAIPGAISTHTRETLVSAQYPGMKADVSIATGYGPCRSCLQVFRQGEDERVYITYNSFEGLSNLPDPGPVFIHKNECLRFEGTGFPPDLRSLPLLLEGFGDQSRLIRRDAMVGYVVEAQIEDIFSQQDVRFINLRNAEAGCFVARVERLEQ